MRSRSNRGSISSRYSPVNEASVTVARSEPEPLTHRIRAGRPRKSTSSALAEVLPPPQLQIERSAPSLRERATSCASTVGTETSVIVLNPSFSNYSVGRLCGLSQGTRKGPGRPQGIAPTLRRIGWPSPCIGGAIPCGRPYAPTSAPPPKVDRKGHPSSTTDQPAKPVESSGVARGILGSTLQLVRMGDRKGSPRLYTGLPSRCVVESGRSLAVAQ